MENNLNDISFNMAQDKKRILKQYDIKKCFSKNVIKYDSDEIEVVEEFMSFLYDIMNQSREDRRVSVFDFNYAMIYLRLVSKKFAQLFSNKFLFDVDVMLCDYNGEKNKLDKFKNQFDQRIKKLCVKCKK